MIQTESGITYIWPHTSPNANANFMCPFDDNLIVTRRCTPAGNWEPFDQQCGSFNDVLNQLDNIFSNVRIS